jgi:hypothetical protein
MANSNPIGDDARKSRISVQAYQVLNIGFIANDNAIRVTPHHGPEQNGGSISHLHVTSQDGIWRYVTIRTDQIGSKGVVVGFVHESSKRSIVLDSHRRSVAR